MVSLLSWMSGNLFSLHQSKTDFTYSLPCSHYPECLDHTLHTSHDRPTNEIQLQLLHYLYKSIYVNVSYALGAQHPRAATMIEDYYICSV